jgi:hypothetical protein
VTDLDARCFIKTELPDGRRALIPADFVADEFLARIPDRREVLMSVRLARSPPHHRWFFGMLRKVVSNTDDRWGDEDDLLDDLKLAAGHAVRRVNMLTGAIEKIAKSINFASMSEDKFRRFRDRCLYIIQVSTGIDPHDLMREVDTEQGMKSLPPARPRRRRKFWEARSRPAAPPAERKAGAA